MPRELTASGLRDGRLRRREDGVVVYATGLRDFEEFPLVRADGLPTQHMRALAYWMAAPELEQYDLDAGVRHRVGLTRHLRRKLMDELMPSGNGDMHPTHDIFNGMVARQKRAVASSEGALLIDESTEWLDPRSTPTPTGARCAAGTPPPNGSLRRCARVLPAPSGGAPDRLRALAAAE